MSASLKFSGGRSPESQRTNKNFWSWRENWPYSNIWKKSCPTSKSFRYAHKGVLPGDSPTPCHLPFSCFPLYHRRRTPPFRWFNPRHLDVHRRITIAVQGVCYLQRLHSNQKVQLSLYTVQPNGF